MVSSTSVDGGDFAGFGVGLHVEDAGAAAGLETVTVDVGALAVAVVGDGEDEAGGEAEFFVELVELGLGGGVDVFEVGAEDFLAVGGGLAGGYLGDRGWGDAGSRGSQGRFAAGDDNELGSAGGSGGRIRR